MSSAGSSRPSKSSPVGLPPSSTIFGCVLGLRVVRLVVGRRRRDGLLLHQVGDDHQAVGRGDTQRVALDGLAEHLGRGGHRHDAGAVRRAVEDLLEQLLDLGDVRDGLGRAVVVVVVDVLHGGAVADPEVGADRVAVGDRLAVALDQRRHGRLVRQRDLGVPGRGDALAHLAAERDLLELAGGAVGRRRRRRSRTPTRPGRPPCPESSPHATSAGKEEGGAQGGRRTAGTSKHRFSSLVEDNSPPR